MNNKNEMPIVIEQNGVENMDGLDGSQYVERMKKAVPIQFELMKELLENDNGFNPFATLFYTSNSGKNISSNIIVKHEFKKKRL